MLRRTILQIEYRQGAEVIRQRVLPLDVATRNGAEWLKFRPTGTDEVSEIRLDSIISFAET